MFIWAMNERRWWFRAYAFGTLLALAFCIVKTQSRGPLLAFAVGVALLAVGPCGAVSRVRRAGFLALFVLLFALFMPSFYATAVARFDEIDQEMSSHTARTRETIWIYTKRMIAERPFTGIGFGELQFLASTEAAGFTAEYGEMSLDNPHNSYLQMTVYAGIPALLAFMLANLAVLARGVRISWRNVDVAATPMVFGLTVGLAGFLVSVYPDMHLFTRDVAPVYWVFFALLFSLVMRQERVAEEASAVAAAPARVPLPATFVPRLRSRRRVESRVR
jgi:O-antigen ligase